MEIQKAQNEDLQEILELQKLCYTENAQRYNDFSIAPLTQTISDMEAEFDRMVILKAIDGQNIIGSVRGIEREGTCYIGRLYVHPEHQNKGIGKQLMVAIENEFVHVGRYELFTGWRDEKNLQFYQNLGYQRFTKEGITDHIHMVYFEKIVHRQ